jgi:tetratricopeptide (TPR) repeat protein
MSGETRDPLGTDQQGVLPLGMEGETLVSRFLPGGDIQAETVAGTNVVSGAQLIGQQHIHVHGVPGQPRIPPLLRPRRAEHFQDRAAEQAWLLAHLHPGRIVTVCGPGGMGKTALVAEVLWTLTPGDSPPTRFPHGIVFHSFYGQPDAAVALEQLARTFGEDPLPTPAEAARRALGGKRALLVLDGAEEAQGLEQVLAVSGSCAVLMTSRRRSDATDPTLLLDLPRLPQDEAVAARICQLVGGLPLALRLAGSYLALHPDEGKEYLAWLEEDLWGTLDQGSSSHKSVPRLLERSVARLRPAAQAVLRLVGLLALAPFARELVAGVLELALAAARRALEEVVDYGLLVRVGASYEVSHPLIHTYARQVLLAGEEATQQAALVTRLVMVLAEHFPEIDHPNWEACERLVPHIQVCAAHLEQQRTTQAEAAALFEQAGRYLLGRARYEQAALLLQRALAIHEQEFGANHPDTASSLTNLARLYQTQGKHQEAEPLLQRALAICEQQLGASHPTTRIVRQSYTLLLQAFSPRNEKH